MNLPVLNTLLEAEVSSDLYQKLITQIDKDFNLTGIDYDFNNLSPAELIICLHEVVEHLITKEYATFLNLLYRIDIPENKVTPTDKFTLEENVVFLILKRQWLKVQLKLKYSS
jgi:hypothetical protein